MFIKKNKPIVGILFLFLSITCLGLVLYFYGSYSAKIEYTKLRQKIAEKKDFENIIKVLDDTRKTNNIFIFFDKDVPIFVGKNFIKDPSDLKNIKKFHFDPNRIVAPSPEIINIGGVLLAFTGAYSVYFHLIINEDYILDNPSLTLAIKWFKLMGGRYTPNILKEIYDFINIHKEDIIVFCLINDKGYIFAYDKSMLKKSEVKEIVGIEGFLSPSEIVCYFFKLEIYTIFRDISRN